ncbi:MAG: WecB/TagA/CpsF family glycosyltransferase [Pseudomonadota bacterium]
MRVNWAGERSGIAVPTPAQGFVTRAVLLADVRARLTGGRGFSIATLNLDHAVKLRRMPEFVAAYATQTHVTADGNPIVWVERLAGRSVELVTGADLVLPLARQAADAGRGVALVGSTPDALERASAHLQERVPGLRISAQIAPAFGFDPTGEEASALARRLAEDDTLGLVFLALGAPKQEIFAAHLLNAAPRLGIASVGAGLDFLAGAQRRAPRVVRRAGLEWLWRLLHDPRRLTGRYARCAALLPGMGARALRVRWRAERVG